MSKVFLGGTCNDSKWRDVMIPLLKIPYFNPVVKNWTPEAKKEEDKQKEICDIHLYTITPKMTGVYSIAELTESAIKRHDKTVILILSEDEGNTFNDSQMKSFDAIGELVKNYGARFFINDYTNTAIILNSFYVDYNDLEGNLKTLGYEIPKSSPSLKEDTKDMNNGIIIEACTAEDLEFHGVFEVAMEGTTISTERREKLPDSAFGIVYTNEDGKKIRKYPLIVAKDKEATKELQRKAIAFFHYCRPDWKKDLAKKIVSAIKSTKSGVKISPKSQIAKYVDIPDDMLGEQYKFDKK
jgi:rRNA maturation protein Rpf1